jgi:endogenous inhibitor of DNA gyrase (YacG/DUF329 family)
MNEKQVKKKSYRVCPKCGKTSVRWHITARRFICEAGCGHIARYELAEAGQKTCGLAVLNEQTGQWKSLVPNTNVPTAGSLKPKVVRKGQVVTLPNGVTGTVVWTSQHGTGKVGVMTEYGMMYANADELTSKVEKRKFVIAGREYWFKKSEIQEAFGCEAKDVDEIWNGGEKQ